MDSEEDTRMEEDTPVTWPSAKGKGKAADVGPEPYDLENLPWYATSHSDTEHHSLFSFVG